MDEGKRIVLIGNETDILHSGFSHAISDAGKRYPSAEHFAHSMVLSRFGLDEKAILDLLACPSNEVKHQAQRLLLKYMPSGHDLNTLKSYLETTRTSYTTLGLRIRIEQDANFEKALMDTSEALLIVCDPNDKELGIGMSEAEFMEWVQRDRLDSTRIGAWLDNKQPRPPQLGANQLGSILMWLRYEVREKRRAAKINAEPLEIKTLGVEEDDPIKMPVSEQIIFLKGVFRPLSNFYAYSFEIKSMRYRSVEHYAYEKLFNSFHLDSKCIEKIVTTAEPCDLYKVAARVFEAEKIDGETLSTKLQKMDRWRQYAMKHKMMKTEYLQQLLLSTGNALLVDTSPLSSDWTCNAEESELQHLLIKDYVTTAKLVEWMTSDDIPARLAHLKGNKCGLLLMELRMKYAEATTSRIPLVSPPISQNIFTSTSHHIICFTPEAVWHPFYPAQIRGTLPDSLLPSPAHYVAHETAKFFAFNEADAAYVTETQSSIECWQRMYEIVECVNWGQEREQMWYMEKRQRMIQDALRLLLEQHAPLLRALLDTGDAFLAYCARWSSIESELTIGMRENDLRAWLATVDLDSRQLVEMCARPLAFRPPYVGGNRLGFILMELRAEFRSKGAFSWALPELPMEPDIILGTNSPTENILSDESFNVLDELNFTSLWGSPLMLLAKRLKDPVLLEQARFVKLTPKLVNTDEDYVGTMVQKLQDSGRVGRLDTVYLNELSSEELRAVFMRMSVNLKQKTTELEEQLTELNGMSTDIMQMQSFRRLLEEVTHTGYDAEPPLKYATPDVDRSSSVPFNRSVVPTSHNRDRPRQRSPQFRTPAGRDSTIENRGRMNDRRDNDRRRDRQNDSHDNRSNGRSSNISLLPKREPPTEPTPPPAPKIKKEKPKEEELSEGEIVDSDDD